MDRLDDVRARIRELHDQLDEEYEYLREEYFQRRTALAEGLLDLQRRHRVGVWSFLRKSRMRIALTAPLIYLGWIPFLLLDVFTTLYQATCFPVYGIPKVRRSDYMVFDRADLPYLNLIEKFNCLYCSYGNGVIAFSREIAARTEQYWCPIKHARRLQDTHANHVSFFDYGDGEAYRNGLDRLRRQYSDD